MTERLGITPRQRQVLDYVRQYIADHNGTPPSYDEICSAIRLRSKSEVGRLIDGLEERGHISRIRHRSRSICIIEPEIIREATAKRLSTHANRRGVSVDALVMMMLDAFGASQ